MTEDKWMRIINDKLEDIPEQVESMKAKYWQRFVFFIVFIFGGAAMMVGGADNGIKALGCFLAVTGVVGQYTVASMYQTQLCFYRIILEIRNSKEGQQSQETDPENPPAISS